MKYLIIFMIVFVSGCSLPADHEAAANKYVAAMCDGVVLDMFTELPVLGLDVIIFYHCAEKGGVKSYQFKMSDVPVEYWR